MQTSNVLLAAKTKIAASEKVTAAVCEATRQAAQLLSDGSDGRIMTNFYGVFSEPHKRQAELESARDTINKALALLAAAPWPSDADYDEL
jgi:hypothetical protein